MAKGTVIGSGFLLLALAGGLYVSGGMMKGEAQQVNPGMEAALKAANTSNVLSLNTARTLYIQAKGQAPEKIEDLVQGGFLSQVPNEAFSKSSSVVSAYDGSGGWVMNETGFSPNHPQTLETPKP
jgi:hypothetical protein